MVENKKAAKKKKSTVRVRAPNRKPNNCDTIYLGTQRREACVLVGGQVWLYNSAGQIVYPSIYLHEGSIIEVNVNTPYLTTLMCGTQIRIKTDLTDIDNNGKLAEVANTVQITAMPQETSDATQKRLLRIARKAMKMAHALIILAIEVELKKQKTQPTASKRQKVNRKK